MPYLERRKTIRGHTLVLLLAVMSFTLAGAGLGFWIGKYTGLSGIATSLALDFKRLSSLPASEIAAVPTEAPGSGEVDAMAVRLGEIQAELMRLNALGERLVQMSGLDPEEFDFENPPPQGGPEAGPVRDYSIKELADELGSVVSLIQDRQRKLDILEGVIVERGLTAKALPAGWPVKSGYISSRFGFRIHPIKKVRLFHEGVDLASPRGTPIMAVADGVVTFSGRKGGYGRLVEIRHLNGLVTRYAHNAVNLVKKGDIVRRGQEIATVGTTGAATGPHVHFEVRKNGKPIDPMPYLEAKPQQTLASKELDLQG